MLFEQVAVLDAQNKCQIGKLFDKLQLQEFESANNRKVQIHNQENGEI
jgi:hypothetical protein